LKIIIAGGREFTDYDLLNRKLKDFCDKHGLFLKDIEVVSGAARGADSLGEQWAVENNVSIKRFKADWDVHGKSAGYRRNAEMADYADALIAFWDGKSKGTSHMINTATSKQLIIDVHMYT